MQKSKGFTIVEVLIVIVVIAILAAITMVSFNAVQGGTNSGPSYVIDTPDGSRYMADSYEEKDGCITFDTWRGTSKSCGSYTVRER